jgi:hypothetical protein
MTIELVDENDISSCKCQRRKKYSDNELLEHLRKFEKEEGRPPKEEDFKNNPKYSGFKTYHRRFGSWNNALQMAELQTKKGGVRVYTDKELLEYLKRFSDEKGRPPTEEYFKNNPKCPSYNTYINRFGGWQKALKLVGLDTDSMIKKCILETTRQKGRLAEIYVLEHFVEKEAKDLSGDNSLSPFDGICPKGETYDVKSSRLRDGRCWAFIIDNICREDIEWFYLLVMIIHTM